MTDEPITGGYAKVCLQATCVSHKAAGLHAACGTDLQVGVGSCDIQDGSREVENGDAKARTDVDWFSDLGHCRCANQRVYNIRHPNEIYNLRTAIDHQGISPLAIAQEDRDNSIGVPGPENVGQPQYDDFETGLLEGMAICFARRFTCAVAVLGPNRSGFWDRKDIRVAIDLAGGRKYNAADTGLKCGA
jgi:hypothetical protein